MNNRFTKIMFLVALMAAAAAPYSGCGGGGASGKVPKIYTEPPAAAKITVRQVISGGASSARS